MNVSYTFLSCLSAPPRLSLCRSRKTLAQRAIKIKQAATEDNTSVSHWEYPTQPSMVNWQHHTDRIQAGEKH